MSREVKDWITGYMKYTENSEPPDLYREWVAVSVIAAVLQRKCYLEWGPLTFYPNMYIVLVGPSGKCRKGTAMSTGASFLRDLNIKMAAEAITREALIRELQQANSTEADPTTGDMLLHSSLTIYSQELTVFLGYDNKNLIADLTDWYDCRDHWTYRTKNMGTDEIIGVWVNLIGATTPELIQSALPQDAIGGGLASRIIFVYEHNKSKLVAAPFLSDEQVGLRESLSRDLEQMNMMSGQFHVTEGFIDKWIQWYTEEAQKDRFKDARFQGYVQRRPNHVMKLSIILSASMRDDRIITAKILDRAIDLLERTEVKMPATFSGVGQARSSDLVTRLMAFIGNEQKTSASEILRNFYYDIEDYQQLERLLQTLERMNFCSFRRTESETFIEYNNNFDMARIRGH